MRMVFVAASVAILAGCGGYDSLGISDDTSPEARRYEVLQALDTGNYDFVIAVLEKDPTYGGAFSEEEGRLNLAAAYVGNAGYDYVDITNELIGADDPSRALISAFAERTSGKTVGSLDRALELYEDIKPNNCDSATTFYEKEACFYYGLVSAVQTTTTLSLAIGGLTGVNATSITEAVEAWIDGTQQLKCDIDKNQNGIPDGAEISACAIRFGADNTTDCGDNVTATHNSTVTFTDPDSGDNFTFEYITVTVNPQGNCTDSTKEDILLTDKTPATPAITDGFCDTNFNDCQNDSSCYPCPVITGDNVLDTEEAILDAINNVDELINVVAEEEDEVSDQLREMVRDICESNPEGCTCDGNECNSDTLQSATDIEIDNITVIADYLTQ